MGKPKDWLENKEKQNYAENSKTSLTRLSIHRKGHRNKEAESHRAGAARHTELCAAWQGPVLHLKAIKKSGQRTFCKTTPGPPLHSQPPGQGHENHIP